MKTFSSGIVLATLLAALSHGCSDEETPRPPPFTDIGGTLGDVVGPADNGAVVGPADLGP